MFEAAHFFHTRLLVETKELMEQRWWQNVAENVGIKSYIMNLGQHAVIDDSSAKAELELLEI